MLGVKDARDIQRAKKKKIKTPQYRGKFLVIIDWADYEPRIHLHETLKDAKKALRDEQRLSSYSEDFFIAKIITVGRKRAS